MATDENVVEFPKCKKVKRENCEDNRKVFLAKVATENGQYRMILQCCNMGCAFRAIMEEAKDGSPITAVLIVGVPEGMGGPECSNSPEPNTSA